MKIAMMSEHASPLATLGGRDAGGQNVHVAQLAAALVRRGHDVTVHTRRDAADLPERVEVADGYVVSHLDAGPPTVLAKDELLPHVPAMGRELAERLAEQRPDVVHAHFWMSGIAALAATPDTGVPVVQTYHALGTVKRRHQGLVDTSPHERIEHERTIARTCARVLASSREERAELIRLGAPVPNVDVVPSGVDLTRFRPDGAGAPRSGMRRVGVVSRLVPRKGVDDAIRAVAQLSGVELLVVGGPDAGFDTDPEVQRLRALADDLGVARRVRMTGPVAHADLAPLLRSCDVVACLPWYEPFGLVPLEAMACAVPVVATAVGGLLDTVVDGETGLHVPPREPHAAAQALNSILADPHRATDMGRAGAQRAGLYSWDAIAERVERSYADAALTASEAAV